MTESRMPPELIREHIIRGFRIIGRARAKRGPYRPRLSSAGKCIRALSYHRQAYPETDPMPSRLGLVFETGDVLHDWMDDHLRKLGLPVERHEQRVEVRTPKGLLVTGHFDRSIGGSTIIDYKTSSDPGFQLARRQDAALPEHRAQTNSYLHACQKDERLRQYRDGLVVMFNVETREEPWPTPPIAYDPDAAAAVLTKFDEVEDHAKAGTLPERPHPSPHQYPCKVCTWRRQCWGDTLPVDQTEPVADLGTLTDRLRIYLELGEQVKGLERERDRAAGAVRAVLADSGTRRGIAGSYEAKLLTFTRSATTATEVTQLRITERKAAPAGTAPPTLNGAPSTAAAPATDAPATEAAPTT